jgi:hypothetical protein
MTGWIEEYLLQEAKDAVMSVLDKNGDDSVIELDDLRIIIKENAPDYEQQSKGRFYLAAFEINGNNYVLFAR